MRTDMDLVQWERDREAEMRDCTGFSAHPGFVLLARVLVACTLLIVRERRKL